MTTSGTWSYRRRRFWNRFHARMAGMGRSATALVSQPEPRTVGQFARGKQLLAGNFLFAGHLIEAPKHTPWGLAAPTLKYGEALHGFGWLDDLVAVGDGKSRKLAQDWLLEWIDRFGRGSGVGWTPDLTGRRIMRWIHHAIFLIRGLEKDQTDRYYRSLAQQTKFLARRWSAADKGLPMFEALTGLVYAALSLEGMEAQIEPSLAALSAQCDAEVDGEGGIPTRNPEELLEVFTLLTWVRQALGDNDRAVPEPVTGAIQRIAPTLRALRHSDGGLARFHGGGRGIDGRLDHALAASGVRTRRGQGLHMGYGRVTAGRTSLIADAAKPPMGGASINAHASATAIEMTSGRRPLIVSCGSGAAFGEVWRRAGRATPSHSTLGIEGVSLARLAEERWVNGRLQEPFIDGPEEVRWAEERIEDGFRLQVSQDGYRKSHGLTHARTLELTFDGRGIVGEDILCTLDEDDQARFDRALDETALQGVEFSVRFHIHPDCDVTVDLGGNAVSIALKSGEIWVFRHSGDTEMTVAPSVYLESTRLKPRATKQVVLSGRMMTYSTRVRWSLAKAQEVPTAIRDLTRD